MNKQIKLENYDNPTENIRDILIHGGDSREARTLVYLLNKRLFDSRDEELLGNKQELLEGTKVYESEFITNSQNVYETVFDCVNKDCIETAHDMVDEGLNLAILNLASRNSPCGGDIIKD